MNEFIEKMVARLQNNLSTIRKVAGWTTEDLGRLIGVTKQTISNLENNKTKMTLTQYIAIRTVLDYKIQNSPDNYALPQVVQILLDNKEESIEKTTEEELSETLRKSIKLGVSTVLPVLPILGGITAVWLSEILKNDK